MSNKSITLYNIYSFLFIIVYIVCIVNLFAYIVCRYYYALKGNNSYKRVAYVKYYRGDRTHSPLKYYGG